MDGFTCTKCGKQHVFDAATRRYLQSMQGRHQLKHTCNNCGAKHQIADDKVVPYQDDTQPR
jgi:transcription elongation factor Elf1